MIELTPVSADRIADVLNDGAGPERRAAKAVRTYRKNPCGETHAAALRCLSALDENMAQSVKQAARQ